jgi:hypothetical protein
MRPISATDWLHGLLLELQRLVANIGGPPSNVRIPPAEPREAGSEAPAYEPLRQVQLTSGAARTLFDEYAGHRRDERGDEETGWVLLGWRDRDAAVVLATLPAGAEREAGEAHVRFNSTAQALASRVVRQADRRVSMLGVVHTHPGSLRHPSDGDYRGDVRWVGQLRGAEGVFGIGTADGKYARPSDELWQPRPNMHCRGDLCFTWYSLQDGARNYQTIPVQLIDGPDLAAPLRTVWPILEEHADRLERLARQQARVTFEPIAQSTGPTLALTVPLAEPGQALRVVLTHKEVRYYLMRAGSLLAADLHEPFPDRGIYSLLAELAGGG